MPAQISGEGIPAAWIAVSFAVRVAAWPAALHAAWLVARIADSRVARPDVLFSSRLVDPLTAQLSARRSLPEVVLIMRDGLQSAGFAPAR